nr:MAG TPA: stabilization protein [Crassvirales sp.]
MQKKQAPIIPMGMQQDLSVGQFPNNVAYELKNMRLVTTGSNTSLCLTNEKSNKHIKEIDGKIIGVQELDNIAIFFVTSYKKNKKDAILLVYENNFNLEIEELYIGNLNFSEIHPIESLGIVENSLIQKIYWVDGVNSPRLIDIRGKIQSNNDTQFDFTPSIITDIQDLQVEIGLVNDVNAVFDAGVIQYALSYYNKNRQQTSILYHSPLYYTSMKGRGLSPDNLQKTSTAFQLKIKNLNPNFETLRVYRITRTSIDATPSVESIRDIPISKDNLNVSFYDTGVGGVTVDPTELLYLGGTELIAETLTQKDNTLFLGNITLINTFIENADKELLKKTANIEYELVKGNPDSSPLSLNTLYTHESNLLKSNKDITFFQKGEVYRFGVQFLSKKGTWSEVVYLGDKENDIRVIPNLYEDTFASRPLAKVTIDVPSSIKLNFLGARLVCVYPTVYDRNVLCQGIICPTVYNIGDRNDNSPYVQSSWFARPSCTNYSHFDYPKIYSYNDDRTVLHKGCPLEWRMADNRPNSDIADKVIGLPPSDKFNAEIMSAKSFPNRILYNGFMSLSDTIKAFKNEYGVDKRIVTFHSPELEHSFNDDLYNISLEGVKFRVVGYVPVKHTLSDSTIDFSNPLNPTISGIYNKEVQDYATSVRPTYLSGKSLVNFPMWVDGITSKNDPKAPITNNGGTKYTLASYPIYPWHRKGSLSNQGKTEKPEDRKSVLISKTMSNLRVCLPPHYLSDSHPMGISNVELWDKDDNQNTIKVLKVKNLWGIEDDITYKGDIDKILTPTTLSLTLNPNLKLPIYISSVYSQDYNDIPLDIEYPPNTSADYTPLKDYYALIGENFLYNNDPIPIQYRSTNHAVFAFEKTLGKTAGKTKYTIIPYFGQDSNFTDNISEEVDYNSTSNRATYPELTWLRKDERDSYGGLHQETFDIDPTDNVFPKTRKDNGVVSPEGYYFVLGELYRTDIKNRFGGDTEQALINNKWCVCSDTVYFNQGSSYTIYATQGDTFLGRYDHLKTYSSAPGNVNNIVDIVSFSCETRINVDGRYDRNRGKKNNLAVSPTNFNLFNKVYSQHNNFFHYPYLDKTFQFSTIFPNQVMWSKTKTLGETIDTWTNINATNVLDLDGDKGALTKLQRINNEIFAFQSRGISRILFNPRVQINTSDRIPIELANSGKVDGKVYITDKYGCENKWALTETPSGVYFVDSINKTLLSFNGQSIIDIATTKGMKSWFYNNINNLKWYPKHSNNSNNGIKLLYDKTNTDVHITTKGTSLAFNEQLGVFTSFYDYGSVDWLFSMNSFMYQIKDNSIWEMRGGDNYTVFFGQPESYYITTISNPEFHIDKVFDTLEFRTNGTEEFKNTLTNSYPFESLEVSNEYQKSYSSTKALKKKFRTWRWQIGRDIHSKFQRDRIRNPWAKIKMEGNLTTEVRLYDMLVSYYV